MKKNGYIATAAKYLSVAAVLLLVNNLLTSIGTWVPYAAVISRKTYITTLVITTLLMFVAFNGEGVGFKRCLQLSGKRVCNALKILLAVAFLYFYFKTAVVTAVIANGAAWLKIMLSLITVVASYSFVLGAVSLWYLIRDRKNTVLTVVNAAVFAVSAVYGIYKFIYYSAVTYNAITLSESALRIFGSNTVMQVMCILQYVADIFMLLNIYKFYIQKTASDEEALSGAKKCFPNRMAYNSELFGTDTLEDDWLVNTLESDDMSE